MLLLGRRCSAMAREHSGNERVRLASGVSSFRAFRAPQVLDNIALLCETAMTCVDSRRQGVALPRWSRETRRAVMTGASLFEALPLSLA